jgi:hypothetical protein
MGAIKVKWLNLMSAEIQTDFLIICSESGRLPLLLSIVQAERDLSV